VERVLGTCVGIVPGSLLAHAVGPSTWSIGAILPALAFGVHFMSVNSALLVMGFTVTVSMLYVKPRGVLQRAAVGRSRTDRHLSDASN
jgi:uncharacterized membrane protein YccC